jgi:hypothetical protein
VHLIEIGGSGSVSAPRLRHPRAASPRRPSTRRRGNR